MPRSPASQRDWTRREFVGAAAGVALALPQVGCSTVPRAASAGASVARKKVALITTIVRKFSHGQHFVDRLLEGYGWQGGHHRAPFDLVALYVDQFPEKDVARERSQRRGVKIFPTIADALTLGTSRLAVDGVLIIGEHGDYPKDAKGQPVFPRYRFFRDVVKTFETTGQSVPLFQDKHFAMDWAEAQQTYRDAKRLGFPMMAGSSLPVTWRLPDTEIALGTSMVESVAVGYGGHGYYDIHTIETAQCMSERRAGGESGVASVQALKGEKVWELLATRETTRRLVFAALNRSQTLPPAEGFTIAPPTLEHLRRVSPFLIAYVYEHRDGFRTTVLHLNGTAAPFSRDTAAVTDFTYAGLARDGSIASCLMYLPMPPRLSTLASFFNPLVNHIETMMTTRATPWPIERNFLTTGMTLLAVDSLHRGGEKLTTPDLHIAYAATPGPHHWRS
jgi:hypothetical protein